MRLNDLVQMNDNFKSLPGRLDSLEEKSSKLEAAENVWLVNKFKSSETCLYSLQRYFRRESEEISSISD